MNKHNLVQAACLLACAATPLAAQSQQSMPEIVVTGTRVATPVTDVIADVTIIDRVVLDTAGQSSLRDVLSQQPGIQLVSFGSYRSSTSVFLRGAVNNQSIVLIDGVRVGSATSGGAALENLPIDRIERIEILRGAASALYGPDAVGGVIQIFTREPTGTLALSANIGGGTYGQKQLGASVRGGNGVLNYSVGISRESATGISVVVNPSNTGYNADLDGFKAASTDAKFVLKPHKDHAIMLSLLKSETNYQIDSTIPTSNPVTPNPLGLTKSTLDTHAIAETNNAALKWDAQWLPQWKSSLLVGSNDEKSRQEYLRATDGALGASTRFNTNRNQLTWQNDILIDKDVLSLTAEARSEAVDSSTTYAVKDRTVQSRLVSYAFNRPQWNSLVALRRDINSQFGGFNNWALSGGYRLTDTLRAVSSAGTSFQAPTFNQLYFPLVSGFQGNPSLLPQQNRASELGLKYQKAHVALSAIMYHNTIQGFIAPSTNVQSSLAVLRGATLSAELQTGNTVYSASYDYADPHAYSSTAASRDLRLVRVARNTVSTRISHRMGDFNVFGELKLSSSREDAKVTGGGREDLGGYSVLNLGTTWKMQKNLSLMARINNVNNTQYMLANGYSMPGRNAFVSLGWTM
jgi:vitamin B12 transporter